ncbi:MAG: mechanosensitive ion channel family protein [Pseudomonadota bacterium]
MTFDQLQRIWSEGWLAGAWAHAILLALASLAVAALSRLIWVRVLARLARRTASDLDDRLVAMTQQPMFYSVLLVGLWIAWASLSPPEVALVVVGGLVKTAIVLLWAVAGHRAAHLILAFMADSERFRMVQVRTRPIFELLAKALVWGGAVYGVLLIWRIDATGWIASAGVVGVAVGFAAKDTVANLISGLFIMADAPYKIGDYVVLGSGERGRVTEIGVRSTRILTRDDIEIILPNAVIANSMIVNEAGGPSEARRVRATVEVAYGSDVDHAREVLMQAARACGYFREEPAPRVRFRSFEASGLRFQVLGWVAEPALRGRAEDALNTAIYKGLMAAGIEIPYSKLDVFLKSLSEGVMEARGCPRAAP